MPNLIPPPHIGRPLVGTGEAVALDRNILAQLRDLAASTATEAAARVYSPKTLASAAFAEGATAVLDWLCTGTPSTELADLLDLEDR